MRRCPSPPAIHSPASPRRGPLRPRTAPPRTAPPRPSLGSGIGRTGGDFFSGGGGAEDAPPAPRGAEVRSAPVSSGGSTVPPAEKSSALPAAFGAPAAAEVPPGGCHGRLPRAGRLGKARGRAGGPRPHRGSSRSCGGAGGIQGLRRGLLAGSRAGGGAGGPGGRARGVPRPAPAPVVAGEAPPPRPRGATSPREKNRVKKRTRGARRCVEERGRGAPRRSPPGPPALSPPHPPHPPVFPAPVTRRAPCRPAAGSPSP